MLWENLTDPILTGREQLGFSKIFCDMPDPVVCRGEFQVTGSWMGYRFLDMNLRNLQPVAPADYPPAATPRPDGILTGQLHYKYIPRTGEWDKADVAYATLTPAEGSNRRVTGMWRGEGAVRFNQARWEDMPTQFMIVNTLHALEIKEYRGATITQSVGGKDLSDQRMLV